MGLVKVRVRVRLCIVTKFLGFVEWKIYVEVKSSKQHYGFTRMLILLKNAMIASVE